jgi:hypothetical protein
MRLAGRLQRPLAHVRVVRHARRPSDAIVRDGGARIDRAPARHRATTGVLGPERVRREVHVVEELQEPAEPAAPGPVRPELPDGAPVGHEESCQVDDAAEERGGAGDEEEAPEAAEAEAVRREGAALRRAALGVAEPLALNQVQDRPRQVRHVRRPLGERLLLIHIHTLVAEHEYSSTVHTTGTMQQGTYESESAGPVRLRGHGEVVAVGLEEEPDVGRLVDDGAVEQRVVEDLRRAVPLQPGRREAQPGHGLPREGVVHDTDFFRAPPQRAVVSDRRLQLRYRQHRRQARRVAGLKDQHYEHPHHHSEPRQVALQVLTCTQH